MTEIEKKALALVNEVRADRGCHPISENFTRKPAEIEALCRAIEKHEADKAAHAATVEGILKAHEAYKQDVSDALVWYFGSKEGCVSDALRDFIIAKPDPLVEVLAECDWLNSPTLAADIREGLAKRGLKIVETGQ